MSRAYTPAALLARRNLPSRRTFRGWVHSSGKDFLSSCFWPLSPPRTARYQGGVWRFRALEANSVHKTVSSGILLTSFAYFLFSLQDASVKWLVAALPVWQIL